MDELELLKKDWQKQEDTLPKLSYDDIYKMILKKSSSIVKWIFIISILEFILWISFDIGVRVSGKYEEIEVMGMEGFSIISSIISYGIFLYFIIRFYYNFKNIRVTDSAKILMQNIIKTRKTVKYYVWVNLSVLAFLMMSTMIYMLLYTDVFSNEAVDQQVPIVVVVVSFIITTVVIIILLALIYRLIYGILTRRLKKNYEELKKLEV